MFIVINWEMVSPVGATFPVSMPLPTNWNILFFNCLPVPREMRLGPSPKLRYQ